MKRRSHRWIVWLLPFLVARAFVPTGFMVSAVAGELSLAFCPSAGPVAELAALNTTGAAEQQAQGHEHSQSDHAHHAQHHSHGTADQHANHFGASDTGVCPFAVVATACAGGDFHTADACFAAASDLLPLYSAPPDSNRPVRTDRIRGPPSLS
jgi:hypothetical protein